jgi:hypothetical protein
VARSGHRKSLEWIAWTGEGHIPGHVPRMAMMCCAAPRRKLCPHLDANGPSRTGAMCEPAGYDLKSRVPFAKLGSLGGVVLSINGINHGEWRAC